MNRFGRSAALAGAALVALVLAIAASATTRKSDTHAAPTAGAAVTNYLTYVKGKRGKADPKKSKVYIGWVNQQGGQVVIGGLATAGAQLAVRYVNDVLGGVGGHPVALVQCFIKSNEEEGTTCGQKLVNNKRISVIATGAGRDGSAVALRDDPRAQAGRHRRRRHPGRRGVEDRRRALRRRPAHPAPFGNYAKNVLKAKTARSSTRTRPASQSPGQVIAAGLKAAGIDDEAGRLHTGPVRPDRAADRGRGDDGGLHRPVRLGGRLREPGEVAHAARHHRLAQDHDGAALPQLDGDRRSRRLVDLDVRDRLVALRRQDRQGHARLRGR
jgi:hypothetical protein